jgi:hypothetical protein
MKERVGFAFVAAAVACAMIAFAQASIDTPAEKTVGRTKVEMLPAAANPNLPFQVLKPLF